MGLFQNQRVPVSVIQLPRWLNFYSRTMGLSSSRKFCPLQSDVVESVELYRPGGFHPVYLGDNLSDGKYRIIHNLGHDGFSTVWLAREKSHNNHS